MAQSPHISVNSFTPHSLPSSGNDAPSTERSVKALQQYSMNSRAFIYSPSTGIEISIIANISTWRANNVEWFSFIDQQSRYTSEHHDYRSLTIIRDTTFALTDIIREHASNASVSPPDRPEFGFCIMLMGRLSTTTALSMFSRDGRVSSIVYMTNKGVL